MQPQPFKIVIPIIYLVGILAPIVLFLKLEEPNRSKSFWSFLDYYLLFLFAIFILLAFLGYLRTKSRTLPVILLVAAILMTVLSMVVYKFPATDAQGGMGIALIVTVQWFIAELAIIACAMITFVHKRKGNVE